MPKSYVLYLMLSFQLGFDSAELSYFENSLVLTNCTSVLGNYLDDAKYEVCHIPILSSTFAICKIATYPFFYKLPVISDN